MATPLKFKANVKVSDVPEYVHILYDMRVKHSIRKAKKISGCIPPDEASVWTLAEVDFETVLIELYRLRVHSFFALKTIRTCRITSNHPAFSNCLSLAATSSGISFDEVGDIWFVARNDFIHKCAPYFVKIGKLGFLTWAKRNNKSLADLLI